MILRTTVNNFHMHLPIRVGTRFYLCPCSLCESEALPHLPHPCWYGRYVTWMLKS